MQKRIYHLKPSTKSASPGSHNAFKCGLITRFPSKKSNLSEPPGRAHILGNVRKNYRHLRTDEKCPLLLL